jgi:outer membrane PBP1 activator LpoA protein
MLHSFSDRWERLGGIVLAAEAYDPEISDYSENLKRMFNITQSEARKNALQEKLGKKLKFTPRRRQDVDFIFLAADAKHGRLIKPQINFYHASRLPVYATSHIFSGKNDPTKDTDLNGVIFGDMPWMLVTDGKIQVLRETLQTEWPYGYTQLDRLYALGMDSYAVIPFLNRISTGNAVRFNGVTSGLSVDNEGRLHRQLLWAQFKRGIPQLLDRFYNYQGQQGIENGARTSTRGTPEPRT